MKGILLAVLFCAIAVTPVLAQMAGPTVTATPPAVSPPGPAPIAGTVGPTPTPAAVTKAPAGSPKAKVAAPKAGTVAGGKPGSSRPTHVAHSGHAKKPVAHHAVLRKAPAKPAKKATTTHAVHRHAPGPVSPSTGSPDVLRPRV